MIKYLLISSLFINPLSLDNKVMYESPVATAQSQNDFVKPLQKTSKNYTISYEDLKYQALYNCRYSEANYDNELVIDQIIEIEKRHNLPEGVRGMMLAAACHESGFNPQARGDHKFSKQGKAMALGLYQMWAWWSNERRGYGIDRTDVVQSTEAYIAHVKKQLPKAKKLCGVKDVSRQWVIAWATAIRKPKKTGRCYEAPKFYRRVLKKWHKKIRKDVRTYEQNIFRNSRIQRNQLNS